MHGTGGWGPQLLSEIWFSSSAPLKLSRLRYWNSDCSITPESNITNTTRPLGRLHYTTLYSTAILNRWSYVCISLYQGIRSSVRPITARHTSQGALDSKDRKRTFRACISQRSHKES